MANLNGSIDKLNSGQGTLGQLLVNPQLYESLNGATRETQALVKDIRANPKKFLRIKLATVLKRLVVNADDFGFTPDVNEGIVEAHRNGILTSTTLMANGDAFDDAVKLAREPSRASTSDATWCWSAAGRCCRRTIRCPASVPELLAAIVSRQIAHLRRADRAGPPDPRRRHRAHSHRHAQAHASGAAGARRGGANRRRSSASPGCAARSIFR